MRSAIFIIYLFAIVSCHSKTYSDDRFIIDPDYRNLIVAYKTGDTLVFKSDRGSIDSFLISSIDSSVVREKSFLGKRPHKIITIKCQKTPPSPGNNNPEEITAEGWVLSILKFPDDSSIWFDLTFKSSKGCLNQQIGPLLKDTVFNGVSINNYYKIEYCGNENEGASGVQTLYSSVQKGIEVYTIRNGEQWIRIK